MKRATAKIPSSRPKPREPKSGVQELRSSRAEASERDIVDLTDDAIFESSLLDYQDEYEGLDLVDDDVDDGVGSWLGDGLRHTPQMDRFPDDGEKRRELRRLQRLRGRPNQQQSSPRAAEPSDAKRDDAKEQKQVDEASESSFPASDPPATNASGVGG